MQGRLKNRKSGKGCDRSPILFRRRRDGSLLDRTTGFAYPRSRFQKGDLSAGKTTVMDELVTHRATRPASPEHRLVPIEVFLANSAEARLNWKRHRLPLAAAFSNAHRGRSIAGRSTEKQARGDATVPCRVKPNSPVFASDALQLQQKWFACPRHRSGHKETAEGDSAETGLSKFARYEGVVEFGRRPNQRHQGIPVLAPYGNLRKILLLDGFRDWLPNRGELSTEKIPTDLIESPASNERLRFLLLPS